MKENLCENLEEPYLEKYRFEYHESWTNIIMRGFSFKYYRASKNKNLWKIGRFFLRPRSSRRSKWGMRKIQKPTISREELAIKSNGTHHRSPCIHLYWLPSKLWSSEIKRILVLIWGIISQEKISATAISREICIRYSWESGDWYCKNFLLRMA